MGKKNNLKPAQRFLNSQEQLGGTQKAILTSARRFAKIHKPTETTQKLILTPARRLLRVQQPMGGAQKIKSWQHPKDFPSGPPPQYYPGPATVNFGVLKRSGVFVAVWPPANRLDRQNPRQNERFYRNNFKQFRTSFCTATTLIYAIGAGIT